MWGEEEEEESRGGEERGEKGKGGKILGLVSRRQRGGGGVEADVVASHNY